MNTDASAKSGNGAPAAGGSAPEPKAGKHADRKAPGERKSKRRDKEAEAERVLVAGLNRLRATAGAIAARYAELLSSEIVQVRETVEASRGASGRVERLNLMLQNLENLGVKPDKGRRKDLKRIEKLVALLNQFAAKL